MKTLASFSLLGPLIDDETLYHLLPLGATHGQTKIAVVGGSGLAGRLLQFTAGSTVEDFNSSSAYEADVILAIEQYEAATVTVDDILGLARCLSKTGVIRATFITTDAANLSDAQWGDRFRERGFAVRTWNAGDRFTRTSERLALSILLNPSESTERLAAAKRLLKHIENHELGYACAEFIKTC